MGGTLEIERINVGYVKRQILFDVSLDLLRGEKALLIGPNGAGKTTLLKAVVGLRPCQGGKMRFMGDKLEGVPIRRRIEKGIGYLLQAENIVPGLTVEENLALGGYYLEKKAFKENKEKVFGSMAFLKPKLKTRAGLLSGGERQALALGMVLVRRPKLLLLDEPSAGLAPKTAKTLIESIDAIQDSFQVDSICMVEHNLKLALAWANKVFILVQGRVVLASEDPRKFIERTELLEKYFFEKGEDVTL